jgi:hypothetical protein
VTECLKSALQYDTVLISPVKLVMSTNCFGQPQTPSIELREFLKRIRCLCTCWIRSGRVLIYKSELDGKEEGNASQQNLLQPQTRS